MESEKVNHPTNRARGRMKADQGDSLSNTPQQETPRRPPKSNQEKLDEMLQASPVADPESSPVTGQNNLGENVFNFSVLLAELPTIIWRSRWDKIAEQVGLPYKRSYMQNLSSELTGPVEHTFNNRIYYKSEDVVRWLNERQSKQ